ncbi:hypothetical protein CSKR_104481 [Clonorchis sinensis]|uniref:Uncharacterized protein n=1 Tax=Clonorchis sinensis TaxID=79923 RepID=A0A419PWG0_CLOSI|nr:hypothetical protein CSKR_104481 [Clonorchis sinensis]
MRVLFSMPNSEWRKQRGDQPLTWQKDMKEITKRLGEDRIAASMNTDMLIAWGKYLTASTLLFKKTMRFYPKPSCSTITRSAGSCCSWSDCFLLAFLVRLHLVKRSSSQCSPRDHCSTQARPPHQGGSFRSGRHPHERYKFGMDTHDRQTPQKFLRPIESKVAL